MTFTSAHCSPVEDQPSGGGVKESLLGLGLIVQMDIDGLGHFFRFGGFGTTWNAAFLGFLRVLSFIARDLGMSVSYGGIRKGYFSTKAMQPSATSTSVFVPDRGIDPHMNDLTRLQSLLLGDIHRAHGDLPTRSICPVTGDLVNREGGTDRPHAHAIGEHEPYAIVRRSAFGIRIPAIFFDQIPDFLGKLNRMLAAFQIIDQT